MRKLSPRPGIESDAEGEPAAFQLHGREEPVASVRWQTAEKRLYPLIMHDPELYEAAVALICEAREVLRGQCATIPVLAAVDSTGVLARCPSAATTTARGIDPDTVVDAARAYRWRELTGHQPADARLSSSRGGHR